MAHKKNRRKLIVSAFQRKLLFLILTCAIIPAVIVAVCLYYLIFNLLAWQIGIPEAVAYDLLPVLNKVNFVMAIAVPIAIAAIWFVALNISHKICGPIYRIEKELDARIAGEKKGPIRLRKNDEFKKLVEKLNKIISA